MDKMKIAGKTFLIAILAAGGLLIFSARPSAARENVTNWYIQNFDSKIKVNKDSTLDITEKITADCGTCAGKHGIFRILPEETKLTDGKTIENPVELVSITDFDGQKIKYTETRNSADNTVTWKIGDPDRTVQGVNYYKIVYRVKNAIRFSDPKFDELYWNLTGNFWDLEIDKFHASLIFPEEMIQGQSTINYYTGSLGEKRQDLASYRWSAPNVLEFDSAGTLKPGQGITASVTFPKNIFVPYQPTFWEQYGKYFAFLIPLAAFCACFWLWWKYGKDPRVDKTVIAEYEIPGGLSPVELGMLIKNGGFENKFITAEIVNLAAKGLVKIKETDNKVLFFHSRDYELTKIAGGEIEAALNPPQKAVLDKIFEKGETIALSSLKNSFYKALAGIQEKTKEILFERKLISKIGLKLRTTFTVIGGLLIIIPFPAGIGSSYLAASIFISGAIILIFSLIMPKRTLAGAELNWQIKGFKLFMETVDKDRAKFYEEQNIFEKFLPYAIVFGITKLWIQKMKELYGEDFYAHYAPVWYVGNVAAFDADSFSAAVDNLSSAIASNTSAPSGSGGGGGAGGGGGGGGGGGW